MTIYANSSNSYWKQREKKHVRKLPLVIATLVIYVVVVVITVLHHRNRGSTEKGAPAARPLTQRRTLEQISDIHWKQCESTVDSRKACTTICQPERNSIQRKTMHQACLHGCQQAHVAATALSCRGKVTTEERVFQEIGGLAYVHCSKFQSTDPKPDTFATCRKYHRAGTKNGFRMGLDAINGVLDEEWQKAKDNSDKLL
ncbi:hypothetical protein ACHAWU_004295 [Discostella pseudostelligera]|uniref:Uncharacterized protein n=1 Tax=Discostella pseudostelligera TaxID=259834 RepID=A0ABD3M2R8_9STRA